MQPVDFPEANRSFGAPADMSEAQVMSIPVHLGQVRGGTCDGATLIVTCWQPSPEEIQQIASGAPVYLSCLGGLPPHFLTTNFEAASRPR